MRVCVRELQYVMCVCIADFPDPMKLSLGNWPMTVLHTHSIYSIYTQMLCTEMRSLFVSLRPRSSVRRGDRLPPRGGEREFRRGGVRLRRGLRRGLCAICRLVRGVTPMTL